MKILKFKIYILHVLLKFYGVEEKSIPQIFHRGVPINERFLILTLHLITIHNTLKHFEEYFVY
jgi:hypothetical protein